MSTTVKKQKKILESNSLRSMDLENIFLVEYRNSKTKKVCIQQWNDYFMMKKC